MWVQLVILIDIHVDAKSLLWIRRRFVAQKVQNIGILNHLFYYLPNYISLKGVFNHILVFLSFVGILVNGLIIGLTSKWSYNYFRSFDNLLILIIIFEVMSRNIS